MKTLVDLTPAVLDLAIYAGDDEGFQVHFQDEAGTLIDVSAFTWAAQIRTSRQDTESHDVSIDASDAVNGNIILTISKDVTSLLPISSQWDLQCTIGDISNTLLQGSVRCSQDVTRS